MAGAVAAADVIRLFIPGGHTAVKPGRTIPAEKALCFAAAGLSVSTRGR